MKTLHQKPKKNEEETHHPYFLHDTEDFGHGQELF